MAPPLRAIAAHWDGAILVCGKCTKKVGGGFGRKGRTPLAKLLRKLMGLKKGRKAPLGIVETRCLGLCPRDAVAMIDARRPDRWLIVPKGADAVSLAAELAGAASTSVDQTYSRPSDRGAGLQA